MRVRRIGVGVIGTGFMGRCHALAFRTAPLLFPVEARVDLAMVADVNAAAAESMARQFGFAAATGDWRALVECPEVDIVAITAPNALHKEMALAAIAAGKHVYCEKPMALGAADAQAMADAAAAAGVRTLVGYNYLHQPAVAFARKLIDRGEIGSVVRFQGVNDEDYMADPAVPHSWRCRADAAGTGTLGDLGSHIVALARYLAGPIVELCAVTRTVIAERPLPGGAGATAAVENEDQADILVRFADGALGTIATSRVAWGRKNRLACEITGSRGTLIFDQERMNELRIYTADRPGEANGFRTVPMGPPHPGYAAFVPAAGHQLGFNDMKVLEVAHLLAGIVEDRPLYPDFSAALEIEKVLQAVVRSAERKAWVRVDEV
jgi:predicted dehydrogenase